MHDARHPGPAAGRRNALVRLGAAGAIAWSGRSPAQLRRAGIAESATPACVLTPEQTEGPYFVDEHLDRSDLRSDPRTGAVKDGALLALRLRVSSIRAAGCEPVAGASVDIWHCDASGVYSDVDDQRLATVGSQFLRGYQVSDADGSVTFTTIYPGWYPGRAVHIHFKIRTRASSGRSRAFTSQLYFDDTLTDRVLARTPYARSDAQRLRNADDGLYRDGGSRLLLPVVETPQGYAATFDVGLAMT